VGGFRWKVHGGAETTPKTWRVTGNEEVLGWTAQYALIDKEHGARFVSGEEEREGCFPNLLDCKAAFRRSPPNPRPGGRPIYQPVQILFSGQHGPVRRRTPVRFDRVAWSVYFKTPNVTPGGGGQAPGMTSTIDQLPPRNGRGAQTPGGQPRDHGLSRQKAWSKLFFFARAWEMEVPRFPVGFLFFDVFFPLSVP